MPGRKKGAAEKREVARGTKKAARAGGGRRGFASMSAEKQREIARMGGRAAHKQGTAHQWTSDEASKAGRKGGRVAHKKGTAHRWDEKEAAKAGRRGGKVAHERGTAHQWTSAEARKAGRKGGRARWAGKAAAAKAKRGTSRSR